MRHLPEYLYSIPHQRNIQAAFGQLKDFTMEQLIEVQILETQIDNLHAAYERATTPMECGHPGVCLSIETGRCGWCDDTGQKPKAKKTRGYQPRSYTDILTEHQAECFADIWSAWPSTRNDGKPGRGDKFRAMEAFSSAIATGYKPEQLVEAGAKYLTTYEADREGFLQMVATFYGPMKRTFMSYLDA